MKITNMKSVFGMTLICLAVLACENSKESEDDAPGIELEYMDTSVRPQDDFFCLRKRQVGQRNRNSRR